MPLPSHFIRNICSSLKLFLFNVPDHLLVICLLGFITTSWISIFCAKQFCLLTQRSGENCYMPVRDVLPKSFDTDKQYFTSSLLRAEIIGDRVFSKHLSSKFWPGLSVLREQNVTSVIFTALCSRVRGLSWWPLLDATLLLLGLWKELEANYLLASVTGQY